MAEQDKKYEVEVEEQNFDDLSAYLKNAMDDAEDYIHQVLHGRTGYCFVYVAKRHAYFLWF
jgi:hypothetical protein